MKTSLIEIKKDEYIWIVSEKELIHYLKIRNQTDTFIDVMNRLYTACFHESDSMIFHPGHSKSYLFAFYFIKGKSEKSISLGTIASTMVIELHKKEKVGTIWSVCNNFDIKGGYMRTLFDYVIRYASSLSLSHLRLFVRFDNPYYEKARALYESKGFKQVSSVAYHYSAITMERELV